jgi:alkanesulfonate monooxygenase
MVSVMAGRRVGIRIFTTCPQTKGVAAADYAERVAEVARWSEAGGCHGILVYTDNGIADPWLVAQLIIQSTHALSPLVAVQPVYMSPYAAAKMVATLGYLHGRRVDLNMVAGGFRNDLLSLADDTAHDDRYERLVEYAQVVRGLLTSNEPFSFEGRYYRLVKARLRPSLDERLLPGFLVSGSSPAGMAAARALGATAVKYPQPAQQEAPDPGAVVAAGIRVGVISRPTDSEAWEVAHDRFPADRLGQLTQAVAMSVSDSEWHRQLSNRHDGAATSADTYWLWPFQNYQTFCPYLVGSHDRVANELRIYLERGFRMFILDIPRSPDDLYHTNLAFERAGASVAV